MALRICCLIAALSMAAPLAQAEISNSPPPFQGPVLAQDRVLSRAIETLQVSSSAFSGGGAIPLANSAYGRSISFPVSWTPGPADTAAYVVIVEDPESHLPQPTLHWLAYNIPPSVTSIGKGVKDRATVPGAKGFLQGVNSRGGVGYVGPHPPAGDALHHYHVQVFALRHLLPLKGGASLDAVLAAMNDRVLAEGELVGTFQAPVDEKKP